MLSIIISFRFSINDGNDIYFGRNDLILYCPFFFIYIFIGGKLKQTYIRLAWCEIIFICFLYRRGNFEYER